MRDPQGFRDIACRCRQDGQAIGQFGDGEQIFQGVGLHQHAYGTDCLELIPVILEANSPLVQKGLARPGRYMFRRSALETWLRQHGAK